MCHRQKISQNTTNPITKQELLENVVPRKCMLWSLKISNVYHIWTSYEIIFELFSRHLSAVFSDFMSLSVLFQSQKKLRKASFFSDLFSSENCGLVSRYMFQKQSRRLPNNSMLSLEKSMLPDLSASHIRNVAK